MSSFTIFVILGVLMIIGGISMMGTPLLTFLSAGYFIIILFLIWGIYGVIRGIKEKNFKKEFDFAVLSLILGIIGLASPKIAAMNNSILLFMAAALFIIRGVLTIATALERKKEGAGIVATVIGILLGVLELGLGVYSLAFPAALALNLGILIGFYFIESGVRVIILGAGACKGSNSLTLVFTIMGILMIVGALAMTATPIATFVNAGYCIIMLFFINGVLGIARAITDKYYGKEFFFAILSLLLGIIGFSYPSIVAVNTVILLYMVAGWYIIRGVISLIGVFQRKKEGAGIVVTVVGIVLSVLELGLGIYSMIHPAALAADLGFMIILYFIESGAKMIFIGSDIAKVTARSRELELNENPANDAEK